MFCHCSFVPAPPPPIQLLLWHCIKHFLVDFQTLSGSVCLCSSFFMICPATQQTRAWAWLTRHMPRDGSVHLRDVTSMFSGINVIGPHAQQLLADITDISTTRADFRPMSCKKMDVGNASGVWAMRLTHTGEDGFILYIPSEVRGCHEQSCCVLLLFCLVGQV